MSNWYAIYVRPRWEKKVSKLLETAGIHCYCPLNTLTRQWSDRTKEVHFPVIPGYLFVHVAGSQLGKVRLVAGVLNYVYYNGKPHIIPPHEIQELQQFVAQYYNSPIEAQQLNVGSKLVINTAQFSNQEAEVIALKNKKVILKLVNLGIKLTVQVASNKSSKK
jgi:transcription antitermination factor NusG